jgi:hypothetical protein
VGTRFSCAMALYFLRQMDIFCDQNMESGVEDAGQWIAP